jgi:DNA-binding CsgD family transcriptional regulator
MLAQHQDAAITWGQRAIDLAEQFDHTEALVHALNNVGAARFVSDREAGREELERSLRLSLQHGLEDHAGRAYVNLSANAVQVRDYAVAERYLDEGIEYSRDRSLDSYTLYMLGWRARYRLDRGAWLLASEDAAKVLAHPRVPPASRLQALVVLGLLRARRGDPGSMGPLDEADRIARSIAESPRVLLVAAARAEAAWISDDPDGVVREAELVAPYPPDDMLRRDFDVIDDLLRRVGRAGSSPRATLESRAWEDAASGWGDLGCGYDRALALASGDDPDATREALTLLEALGATATAAAVARDSRARGVRGVPRGPRPATRSNPAELTPRQLEVLEFLVEGMRNAEIAQRLKLSPRTADHHVSAVLAKLGVRTRGEAAAAARKLGILAP